LTFRKRENPHSFASFRSENYLASRNRQCSLDTLGRSGITIQHSFNLLAFEHNDERTPPWVQRQTAAYHSFDLETGRGLWIVIKGNKLIRERVKESTAAALARQPGSYRTVENAFDESLRIHTLLFAWIAETLPAYIGWLEEELKAFSDITRYAPVEDLASDAAALKTIPRMDGGFDQARRDTMDFRTHRSFSFGISGPLRRATSGLSRLSRFSRGQTVLRSNSVPLPVQPAHVIRIKNLNLEELLSFNQLQALSRLMTEVDQAITVIDQNLGVLVEIQEKYKVLLAAKDFQSIISGQALQACETFFSDFVQQVRRLERDVRNQQARLRMILRNLENIRALVGLLLTNILGPFLCISSNACLVQRHPAIPSHTNRRVF
jgi:hypothetical protein